MIMMLKEIYNYTYKQLLIASGIKWEKYEFKIA